MISISKKYNLGVISVVSIFTISLIYITFLMIPANAISNVLVTPNTSNCQYEGPYDSITGNFSCASTPANSNQTFPKSYTSPSGQYPSSYNSSSGITNFSPFPIQTTTNQTPSPSLANYYVYQNASGTLAYNTQTGKIDFYGSDPAVIIQSAATKFYPKLSSVYVECGIYNLKSSITTYSFSTITGCGEGQTIFKRSFNGTYLHTIVMNPGYNGNNGYAVLKDFTVDGNYGHVDNLQDEIAIVGHGYAENIEIKNYNAIGIQIAGDFLGYNLKIIGVNSSSSGSTMGIWQAPNTNTILNNPDIENNRIPAILSSGSLTINGGTIKHNHIQTSPTGGGQIAIGQYAMINNVMITNGGGTVTSGIETNAGIYTLSGNIITGNKACGIASNGQVSTIIVTGNYLKGNGQAICQNAQSVWLLSNNAQ